MTKSFPRGGKKLEVKKSSNVLPDWKAKSNKKCNAQTKKRNAVRREITDKTNLIATTAERLSYMTVCERMTVLCRVSQATEYELIVSIPGGLMGRVQVTDLGESYTNLLQSIINSENVQTNEFKSLPDLYKPGDYIVCYVQSINPEGKWLVGLSLEPSLINQNIDNSYLMKGTKIVSSIKSIEDHGYVVDTGIANVRAFIPTKSVSKGKQYFPGNQVFCIIKEINTIDRVSVVTLSAKRKITNSINTCDIVSLDVLTPGTKLSLCVQKVLANGLQVRFGKDNIGYVNQIYLDNPLSTYIDNMELTGTLLYIMPTVKLAYFSLLTDTCEEMLNIGDKIKKAVVLYRESNGIVFKISKSGQRGFVSLRRTNVPFSKIPTDFKSGTVHKCRILSYNWMEHLYVCTMESNILKQKYFSISDLNFGDILNVKVTKIDTKSGFIRVQAGKIHGVVAPEHVSDNGLGSLNVLKLEDDVEGRVLDIDYNKQSVRFTLKPSLIKSELPVLHNIHEARCKSTYHGTITKINKNGLLVRFYGDVKGWVPRTMLDKDTADMNWNYYLGQTVTVSIDSIKREEGKMKLKISAEQKQQQSIDLSIGEVIEGTVIDSSIEGIHLRIYKTGNRDATVTGFLPAGHMAPCNEIGSLLASKYTPGDVISALVFSTQPSVILSRTYVTHELFRSFDTLKVGNCIPCTIRDIQQDGVKVVLSIEGYSKLEFIPYKNISNFNMLHTNQILFVKITAINVRQRQLSLTMVLKDVWESSLEYGVNIMSAVDVLNLYLNKLSELSTNAFYKDKPISSAILGQKITGHVEKITEHGLVLRLDSNLTGTVRKDHYSGNLKVGNKVFGTILWKNYVHDLVDVSLLPRIVNSISSKQRTLQQLPNELVLRGEILMITNWLILVLVKRNGAGYLVALSARRHVNDISPDLTSYTIHAKIRLRIVMNRNESSIVPIGMLKSAFEVPKEAAIEQSTTIVSKKLKRKISALKDTTIANATPKKSKTESDNNKTSTTSEEKLKIKASKAKREKIESGRNAEKKKSKKCEDKDIIKGKREIRDIGDNCEMDENEVMDDLLTSKVNLFNCEFWNDKSNLAVSADTETNGSDKEEKVPAEQKPERKNEKLSASERREQERQKESQTRQWEEILASDQIPKSIDQLDKLVLSSPHSSMMWLKYMAYHLQASEIDEARTVARRAIKMLNSEEKELLNVWNAWLNIESKFGTPESLNNVFQEAVRMNDAFKIYMHMLTLHMNSGRQVELEELIATMIRKFKQNFDMWVECGAALLKIGLKEKSRHIMQRALQSLPAFHHVNLMVRFANLENKLGDKKRSQTLYEQILISYPKRVDVWSAYIDSLVKSEDIDIARRVLERAIVQTLPLKKMKTLFQKFLEFEMKYGTPEAVAHIRQMAADYVERVCSKETV